VTPLDLYLREASDEAARMTVHDFGQAIKDLAANGIFPRRAAAEELRCHPSLSGRLLRLRRAFVSHRFHVPRAADFTLR
jgi:hypothetical protein